MPVNTRGAIMRSAPGKWEVVDLVSDDPAIRRDPGQAGRLGPVPLRRPHRHRRHAGRPLPDPRRPRGRRRRHRGRPEHARLRGGRPRRLLVPARLRPLPLLRQRACRTCATSARTCSSAPAGTTPRASASQTSDGTHVGQMCGISARSPRTTTVDVRLGREDRQEHPARGGLPRRLRRRHRLGHPPSRPASVTAGDTVIVMGIGGIGINAVQGAAHAGASHVIAVDPVAFKREKAHGARRHARLRRPSTRPPSSPAASPTARARTRRSSPSACIKGEHVAQAFDAIRKAGTVVVTGARRPRPRSASRSRSAMLTLFQQGDPGRPVRRPEPAAPTS